MKKNILQSIKIILLGFILSLGIGWLFAWTGPIAAPPVANAPGPINTSITDQQKIGGLDVGGGFTMGTTNGFLRTSKGFLSNGPAAFNNGVVVSTTVAGSPAAVLNGAIPLQILNGAGAGKVLTSDANGVGTWQTVPVPSLSLVPIYRCPTSEEIGDMLHFQCSGQCRGQISTSPTTCLKHNTTFGNCDNKQSITCPFIGNLMK